MYVLEFMGPTHPIGLSNLIFVYFGIQTLTPCLYFLSVRPLSLLAHRFDSKPVFCSSPPFHLYFRQPQYTMVLCVFVSPFPSRHFISAFCLSSLSIAILPCFRPRLLIYIFVSPNILWFSVFLFLPSPPVTSSQPFVCLPIQLPFCLVFAPLTFLGLDFGLGSRLCATNTTLYIGKIIYIYMETTESR